MDIGTLVLTPGSVEYDHPMPLLGNHLFFQFFSPGCLRIFPAASAVPAPEPRFVRFKQKWQKLGSLSHAAWGKPCRTVWLSERPARRGGAWAIGCTFCAHLVDHLAKFPEERKRLYLGHATSGFLQVFFLQISLKRVCRFDASAPSLAPLFLHLLRVACVHA